MNLGPTYVVSCPHCCKEYLRMTLLSGNTFGALVWTDGRMLASMLPESPVIIQCKSCGKFSWVKDMKEREYTENEDYDSFDQLELLDAQQYLTAIKLDVANDLEKELFLRIKYWQCCNDAYRGIQEMNIIGKKYEENEAIKSHTMSEENEIENEIEKLEELMFTAVFPVDSNEELLSNLERLIDILPNDFNNQLIKGEILRELGRFEESMEVLKSIENSKPEFIDCDSCNLEDCENCKGYDESEYEESLEFSKTLYNLAVNHDKNIKLIYGNEED